MHVRPPQEDDPKRRTLIPTTNMMETFSQGIAPPPWQPSIWPVLKIISGFTQNCFGDFRWLRGTYIISAQLYRCIILHVAFAAFFAATSQLTQEFATRFNKTETISILRSHLRLLPGIIQAPLCLAPLSAGVLNMGSCKPLGSRSPLDINPFRPESLCWHLQ